MEWAEQHLDRSTHSHDHFTIPSIAFLPEVSESYRNAYPKVRGRLQRYMIDYHAASDFYEGRPDHNLLVCALAEAVRARLYSDYGGNNRQSPVRNGSVTTVTR